MPQLLDAYGRPVKTAALTQPQAEAGVTSVRQAFQTTIASGLTPQRLAGILRACDEGQIGDFMVLAEEMEERDAHYASVLGQRKRAISGVRPTVMPASDSARDQEIAAAVEADLARHDGFAGLVEDLMDAVGKGFAVVEIDWRRGGGRWRPEEFVWRPQSFFQVDRETGRQLRLRDATAPVEGVPLAPFKFLVHRAKLKSGHMFRGGLARVVAFAWMCKAYTLKDWMAFIETYGLPLRLGRYGPEATPKDVEALFRAVANIGTDAAAVLPRSMEIEFTETKAGGGSVQAIFENFARYADEQVSKAVLGQTMTADSGSSMAQAVVHNDVRYDIAASDARSVTGTLNRDLVRPFVDLNWGVQKAYPVVSVEIAEPEDIEMLVGSVEKLAARGVRFSQAQLRRKLGLDDPEKGEETFGGAPEASEPPPPPGKKGQDTPSPATARTATAREAGPWDELDEIEAGMLAEWEPVMAETLGGVEAAFAGAANWEEAMERLAAAGLPSSKLIDALVKGAFKARALGDVRDG